MYGVNTPVEKICDWPNEIVTNPVANGISGYMKWPEKLTKERMRLRFSQEELGDMIGVQASRISRWESGQGRPYLDQGLALAKALGVSLDYFADDELDEPPAPEMTEEEWLVIDFMRDYRLSGKEAIRGLAIVAERKESVSAIRPHEIRNSGVILDDLSRRLTDSPKPRKTIQDQRIETPPTGTGSVQVSPSLDPQTGKPKGTKKRGAG
jgi:transcriptional regulator with XRE-family HTH domain